MHHVCKILAEHKTDVIKALKDVYDALDEVKAGAKIDPRKRNEMHNTRRKCGIGRSSFQHY